MVKLALICGGPSGERGISLNSARSACDHLEAPDIEIVPIYIDLNKKPYKISRAQLYSNTPSDFDFKLKETAKPLTQSAFKKLLKEVDLALPVIHGDYGEDGEIQKYLEDAGCPFIGASEAACKNCFDKSKVHELLKKHHFYTEDTVLLTRTMRDVKKKISAFFKKNKANRVILKPAIGGSSLGVYSAKTPAEAYERFERLTKHEGHKRVVIQPFCKGTEFTVILLENRFGIPVSLPPIEIATDYSKGQIFDYRKKYLATNHVAYHCPARYSDEANEKIQTQAEQLFSLFGMKGFARFDGYLLPSGDIWFFDFNPISGMEQNSFLFIGSTQIGMSHADLLRFLVKTECDRNNIPLAAAPKKKKSKKRDINLIFGGDTAERQVSLMSGTNVWLKLRQSEKFDPHPHLLDTNHDVWRIPYSYALHHTVEEIMERCHNAKEAEPIRARYAEKIAQKLSPLPGQLSLTPSLPKKMSLDNFIKKSKLVFNTIHGGIGENGELQKRFKRNRTKHNGSDAEASELCADKYRTGEVVRGLNDPTIHTAEKLLLSSRKLSPTKKPNYRAIWNELLSTLNSKTVIVKPPDDGCSAGIVRLFNANDLKIYSKHLHKRSHQIEANTLTKQSEIVEMPSSIPKQLLFEEFIETDEVIVKGHKLQWKTVSHWIEITAGVIGKKGKLKALNPSITVATNDVLSLEEKFQGGTGVNITPPPKQYVPEGVVRKARAKIAKVANALGIGGYSRIDAFLHIKTGEVIIIEANTLPGLTGSTVIFHQALAERPSVYPKEFLEKIVSLSL